MLPVAKPYIKRAIDARTMMSAIIIVIFDEAIFFECLKFTEL